METNFALAQIEAGADVIGIGDAAASLVSPDLYRAYILPYERRIIEAIRATGTPVRLHICGNTNHLLRDIATLDMEMIDIDCLTDLRRAREEIPADVAILGNVDPVRCLLEGEPEEVARAFADCYETVGDRYVVGPGCEVPPLTPHDNVRAMVEWARR
jgi:MtaA/CmuA family methyltransferase